MISIHALREEGDLYFVYFVKRFLISIHALREEGDKTNLDFYYPVFAFLSTPSARRATELRLESLAPIRISIHALREEGDRQARSRVC